MKMQNKILAYLGLLGMTALIAILWSIRDKLIAIAPWVLGVLLTVIGLVMAWLLHKLYVNFKKDRLALHARMYEVEGQKQALRLENERWQVERDALLLGQHLQSARIYPDGRGFMPTLVNLTEAGYQYISLPHPAHQGRITGQSNQQAIPEHADSLALPISIRYEQVASQIPRGHTLLGVSAQGVETKEFAALKTMLISGGSDSGKSNTLAIKIDEAMRLGRNTGLIVIDWHAYKPDSLTNKIKCYEHRFLLPVVTEEEDTVPVLKRFLGQYQNRRRDMKEAAEQGLEVAFDDILLVCDEVPEMLDSGTPELRETLTQVAKICGRSARGFGLFGWFVCQNMVGAASIRNYAHTIIGHKAVMLNEQKMVANGHNEIIQDMDQWPKGRVVVYGQSFTGTQVLQMPIFTPPAQVVDSLPVTVEIEALQPKRERSIYDAPIFQPGSAFLSGRSKINDETTGVSDNETNGGAGPDTGKLPALNVSEQGSVLSTKKETSGVSEETKKIILRMHRSGMPWREIARLVGLSGEKYALFKQACQELGIQPGQVVEGL